MKKTLYWNCALFPSLITFLFYLSSLNNDFVNWDDKAFIVDNPNIRSLNSQSLKWMFANHVNWTPLTWLSLAADLWIGGINPKFFHFINIVLHSLNTLLVFWLCFQILRIAQKNKVFVSEDSVKSLEIYVPILTALLFGLHPIHVESVAWAAERKDVLYAFFYISALIAYLKYASETDRKPLKLAVCFGLFLFSLMSKPMAVTLPLVLLILDYWPLQRFQSSFLKIAAEKVPFIIPALLVGLLTKISQESFISNLNNSVDISLRLNPFRSLFFYLWKMLLPINLVPFYPLPYSTDDLYALTNVMAILLMIIVTYLCFHIRQKFPAVLASWLYYLATLLPVLGFIQVGSQAAADRYTYLCSLGPFLLFSVGIVILTQKRKVLFFLLCLTLVVLLGCGTIKQIGIWHNSETLWKSVLKVYPDESPIPYTNLGIYYMKAGRPEEALEELEKAVIIPPPYPQTNNALGAILLDQEKIDEAIQQFQQAVSLEPNYINAHENLAVAYERKGLHDAAWAEQQKAEALKHD